jgi:hypothetical protein
MSSNNGDADKKFCILCKRKTPPVYTVLILGENIIKSRYYRGIWECNDCYNAWQKDWRENRQGRWTEYYINQEAEQLEKFEKEWNDKEFRNRRELSDKLLSVLIKAKRREPQFGLYFDIMCAIIFKSDWNVSINRVVNDLLKTRNDTAAVQNRDREILLRYIPNVIDVFTEEYRRKSRDRLKAIIYAIKVKYGGKEKLVCKPYYKNKKTKQNERRWYLLSYEPELNERNEINDNKKLRIDFNKAEEFRIVEKHEQERAQEKFEETKQSSNRESNKDDVKEENEGGE